MAPPVTRTTSVCRRVDWLESVSFTRLMFLFRQTCVNTLAGADQLGLHRRLQAHSKHADVRTSSAVSHASGLVNSR